MAAKKPKSDVTFLHKLRDVLRALKPLVTRIFPTLTHYSADNVTKYASSSLGISAVLLYTIGLYKSLKNTEWESFEKATRVTTNFLGIVINGAYTVGVFLAKIFSALALSLILLANAVVNLIGYSFMAYKTHQAVKQARKKLNDDNSLKNETKLQELELEWLKHTTNTVKNEDDLQKLKLERLKHTDNTVKNEEDLQKLELERLKHTANTVKNEEDLQKLELERLKHTANTVYHVVLVSASLLLLGSLFVPPLFLAGISMLSLLTVVELSDRETGYSLSKWAAKRMGKSPYEGSTHTIRERLLPSTPTNTASPLPPPFSSPVKLQIIPLPTAQCDQPDRLNPQPEQTVSPYPNLRPFN